MHLVKNRAAGARPSHRYFHSSYPAGTCLESEWQVISLRDICCHLMKSEVWQEVDVEGELRLELRGVDVLPMEAEGNPLRKLHARDRLR